MVVYRFGYSPFFLSLLTLLLFPIQMKTLGGHIAHIGGAIMGFLFIFLLRRGYDSSEVDEQFFRMGKQSLQPRHCAPGEKEEKVIIRDEYFYKKTKQPFKKTPNVTQQRIDEILDKNKPERLPVSD